ncbi:GGDEF domain-containing protein [Alicyclobacillus sp. SO9]|uniref:GGDEF domain-containing protein n=1 Tax=Alicyclobacillus sp. SO9 TaxID=2665646 RepID=UPI0018E800BD|nr:GGDEF domain-containing protein [Alicyclobacillus sp. SO9]QQE79568.1 GGDEF domain-containing protein [Alicyclobacillus sp. SO9]
MTYNGFREFFSRLTEGPQVSSELDFLREVGGKLRRYTEIDSGFFVYCFSQNQERSVKDRHVCVPWGMFQETYVPEELMSLACSEIGTSFPTTRRWVPLSSMPRAWRAIERRDPVHRIGIWPLMIEKRRSGMIVAATGKSLKSLPEQAAMLFMDAVAAYISSGIESIGRLQQAEEVGRRDALTGLYNRRGFEEKFLQIQDEADKLGCHVLFALIDLDDFKQINDTQGHPAGDMALKRVGRILHDAVAEKGIAARYGGDEFAVVLLIDERDLEGELKRLQEGIVEKTEGLSVSVGGAINETKDDLATCYEAADERLYVAKRSSQVSETDRQPFFITPEERRIELRNVEKRGMMEKMQRLEDGGIRRESGMEKKVNGSKNTYKSINVNNPLRGGGGGGV